MASIEKIRNNIREQFLGLTNKKIVLVEGLDDVKFFNYVFTKKFSAGWENTYAIAPAGKKDTVIEILKVERSWIGIIDRDEWDQDKIDSIYKSIWSLYEKI